MPLEGEKRPWGCSRHRKRLHKDSKKEAGPKKPPEDTKTCNTLAWLYFPGRPRKKPISLVKLTVFHFVTRGRPIVMKLGCFGSFS